MFRCCHNTAIISVWRSHDWRVGGGRAWVRPRTCFYIYIYIHINGATPPYNTWLGAGAKEAVLRKKIVYYRMEWMEKLPPSHSERGTATHTHRSPLKSVTRKLAFICHRRHLIFSCVIDEVKLKPKLTRFYGPFKSRATRWRSGKALVIKTVRMVDLGGRGSDLASAARLFSLDMVSVHKLDRHDVQPRLLTAWNTNELDLVAF